ncbi:unnamed protein product [Acanthoscelides obtectus]|uniref:Chloride channel CLIC-like protein 1 n=2 Tax=Acanthoscelides obtectus TaxID=200917 RepID=A0A9P0JUU9_ACAOB|nr:unnamed protein product [Acanthoscelides obtectus]CAK1621326.1 hypothetical protein AOBTE_LOCUS894 [Acanthoscelides obtectus]
MRWAAIFLVLTSTEVFSKQWIDPHDMNTNAKEKLRETLGEKQVAHITVDQCNCSEQKLPDDTSLLYLKRMIALMVNSATLDEDSGVNKGKFNIHGSDYQFLKKFSERKYATQDDLQKLDGILSSMFTKSTSDEAFESLLSAKEKFLHLVLSHDTLVLVGVLVCLYVAVNMLRSQYTVGEVICYFCLMILIIDYGFRYKTLREEAEEHNMSIKYTSKCDTSQMSWKQWLLGGNKNCEKKVISPLEVLLLQVKHVIVIPGTACGTAFGGFANEMWTQLPFPWNMLIFPALLLFVILLIAVILTVTNNQSFCIKLMHLFHIEFGDRDKGDSRLAGRELNAFLEGMKSKAALEDSRQRQRPALENRPNHRGEKNQKKPWPKKIDGKVEEKYKQKSKENAVDQAKARERDQGNKSPNKKNKNKDGFYKQYLKGDGDVNKENIANSNDNSF